MKSINVKVNGCRYCKLNELEGKYEPENIEGCELYQLAVEQSNIEVTGKYGSTNCAVRYVLKDNKVDEFSDSILECIANSSHIELISINKRKLPKQK